MTPVDISTIIEVDSTVLNFEKFYPGRVLGTCITIKNISKHNQVMGMDFDSEEKSYSSKKLLADYDFTLSDNRSKVSNCEADESLACFWVENPSSKQLTKVIKIILAAGAS